MTYFKKEETIVNLTNIPNSGLWYNLKAGINRSNVKNYFWIIGVLMAVSGLLRYYTTYLFGYFAEAINNNTNDALTCLAIMTLIGMGIQWLRYKKNRLIITKIKIQMKLDLYKHYHKLRSSGNKQWMKSKNTIVISTAINSGISAICSIIENIFQGCNSILEGFVTICVMSQYTG